MKKLKVFAILGSILLILTVWNVSWAAKSWVLKGPAGSYIDALYCDPANPNTVYAGTNGGVYKTMNLGDTWSYSGVRPRWINALGAEPGCGILYAGGWNEVLGTSDGGLSWNSFATLSEDVTALASSSAPSCIGYAGTENGVYATNGNSGLTDADTISTLALDSNNYVYAGTEGSGLFKSTNAGLTWAPVLNDRMIFALVIDSSDRVFVASLGDGVLLSINGGTTWDPKNNGLPAVSGFPGAYVVLSLVKDSAGVLYAGVVTNINPLSGAVYKSVNNGDNWTPTNPSLSYTAESLCVTPTNRLFVGTSRGVFRTDDGGANWINQTGRFGGPYITNSFTVANNGAVLVASDGQGVLKSTDGGETWAPAGTGLPQEMMDVKKDAAGNLYATGFGGVYKSTDQGTIWTPSSNGIPGNPAGPLTIPPTVRPLGSTGMEIYTPGWMTARFIGA